MEFLSPVVAYLKSCFFLLQPAMVKNDTYYLNNHLHFTVKYHRDEANPSFGRIVFVSVTPQR